MLEKLKSFRDWLIELGADVLLEGLFEFVWSVFVKMLEILADALSN
ncbi:hypothetical protein MTX78_13845 [Hymenobacter tibetensis]|uniref:Uncharacterized protein n=1 Tax=Hymenobacter tibetensis TaxID=497967 RepID=A0ABY4CSH4_9BACT|nr:hypothetical protein [Hymenobacter tibetensis]UOG73206.1 hypothetical protein MTX78_13845 [Hymenobacter tibetensis]